ncbi:MAG: ImmA/IrrE family metallo-endopeptidase, partial [Akkermansiaceae bacterium]|nr:ImmA/IrrE family metallo-endopeptidase [Akkermansiaceae bacterium]
PPVFKMLDLYHKRDLRGGTGSGNGRGMLGSSGGGSFSVTVVKPVRDCVEELAAGRERGMLRNTAWGRDIAVPLGQAGKRGYGIKHIQEKRILHGLSPDDAAFVTVCALNAAQSVKTPETRGNKDLFDRFGVRAVVAKDDSTGHMVITGFVLNTKGGNRAVDSEAAQLAQHFYALDELSRIQQVGAALKKAVARFEDIVNKNPHDWENVVSYEVEMLKIKQNARQDGTYMKAPNGEKTKLSERQWAAVRTEAFKEWFGDWERDPENASKVVDENGEPMVVYHGTQRDFGNVFRDPEEDRDWRWQYDMNYAEDTYWFADHAFTAQTYQSPQYLKPDRNYVQTAKRPRNKTPLAAEDVEYTFYKRTFDRRDWPVDTPVSAEEALKKDGTLKEGRGRTSYDANMRLKPGRKTPQGYEGLGGQIMQFNTTGFHGKVPRTLEEALDWWNRGIAKDEMPLPQESRLYEVFLNVRNPLIIDEHGKKFREMGRKAYRAKNTGHDGLIVKDVRDPGSYEAQISNGKSIAVFKPEQIKSATENRGTYSSRNADITFSVIGPRAKTFSKYLDKAFLGRDDGKMRAEIDASQARLKGAWTAQKDLGRLATPGEKKKLDELRHAWDEWQKLAHSRKPEELAEKQALQKQAAKLGKELEGLADRMLKELGYHLQSAKLSGVRDKARRRVLLGDMEGLINDVDINVYKEDRRKLGEVLDYPELFDAYPELAEMEAEDLYLGKGNYGSYDPQTRIITINEALTPEERRSTLLHEIQHAIQDIEGFAEGSSPISAADKRARVIDAQTRLDEARKSKEALGLLPEDVKGLRFETKAGREEIEKRHNEVIRAMNDLRSKVHEKARAEGRVPTEKEYAPLDKAIDEMLAYEELMEYFPGADKSGFGNSAREVEAALTRVMERNEKQLSQTRGVRKDLSGYELYRRTAGEIESRNVQERRDWTAEQRQ